MNYIDKKESELEKMSLTFKEIKDFLIKDKTIKDEYRQAAIVLVRNVFSRRQTNVEANEQHDSKALHIANVNKRFLDEKFIPNVCLSYRHDFGLLPREEQEKIIFECKEWMRAIANNLPYS